MPAMEVVDSIIGVMQELLDNGEEMAGYEIRQKSYEALISLLAAEKADPDGHETYQKVRFGVTKALAMIEGVIPMEPGGE